MRRAALRAAKIAPAVAAVAALAAAPHVPGQGAPAEAEHMDTATAHLTHPGQVPGRPTGQPASITDGLHRPQRVPATGTSSSVRTAPKGSRSTAATSRRSASHRHRGSVAAARRTLTCTGTSGMLPANYAAIVGFLTAHGYTGLAAAGIAGNIYQESKGDPESVGSGGGGLIGWTPLPAGFVTGNIPADLRTQLEAILTYNQQWSAYVPALNAATSATEAADIYMSDFERPGVPAASSREAAADAVAAACRL
jgi:hypothetical protein